MHFLLFAHARHVLLIEDVGAKDVAAIAVELELGSRTVIELSADFEGLASELGFAFCSVVHGDDVQVVMESNSVHRASLM